MDTTMKAAPLTARVMADHWNGRAERFNPAASHVRHREAWRTVFENALGSAPRDAVDLGCGTGACALLLAELGHRVRAVDGSDRMLDFARQEALARDLRVEFVKSTMDEANLDEDSAGIVTIRNVLWTLENPEGALLLARRILRPGGILLVSDGLWRLHRRNDSAAQFGAELPFFNGVTEADARAMLATSGFETIRAWQYLFDVHPYGAVYDDPTQTIAFFVLTAVKAGARADGTIG